MTLKTRILSFIFILAVISSLSIISAQTLVAGKVYDFNYGGNIADADVVVTCNHNSLTTISLNDGTYAVRFEQPECTVGDSVKVSATKGELIGSGSGMVIECEEDNCDEDYFSLINLALKPRQVIQHASSGSSSGSSRVYICGNGKCDSGETQNTCPKDCKVTTTAPILPENSGSGNNENTAEQTGNNDETIDLNKNEAEGKKLSLFGISGASIGIDNLFKMPSLAILIAFIVLIIVLAIILVKLK